MNEIISETLTYRIETLEQIKYICEEHGHTGEVEAIEAAIKSLQSAPYQQGYKDGHADGYTEAMRDISGG